MATSSKSLETLTKIEKVVVNIIRDLMKNQAPVMERENLALKRNNHQTSIEWAYKRCRRNFALLTHLMDNIYCTVQQSLIRTKRDLFYENVLLYKNQNCLDNAVTSLGEILQVSRALLNVEATAKGLVAGSIQWTGPNGEHFDATLFNRTGMLIPPNICDHRDFKSNGAFVLVVEKDAIFQKLLNDRVFDKLGEFILVTGKGYPDFATRYLLHILSRDLKLPTLALVDNDPHGIEIAAIYKWGSYGELRKENFDSSFRSEQTVPDLIWAGLLPSEMQNIVPTDRTNPLTTADRRKLAAVEERLRHQNDDFWVDQILTLKSVGRKAEIEALRSGFLTDSYLRYKVDSFVIAKKAQILMHSKTAEHLKKPEPSKRLYFH